MTYKIGITGVHGAGKSTKVKELEGRFIELSKTVYMVHEVARSCPCTLGTVEAEEWIWGEQMEQEKHATQLGVDVVICDRTVMDNLVYYRDILLQGHVCQARFWQLYRIAIDWMPTYNEVIRLPLNLEWLQADDPIRPKDVAYARRIDALFDRFVQPHVTDSQELI